MAGHGASEDARERAYVPATTVAQYLNNRARRDQPGHDAFHLLIQTALSSFEVTPPHSLEQGDRRERGQRVEASDENEHRGPTPCLRL